MAGKGDQSINNSEEDPLKRQENMQQFSKKTLRNKLFHIKDNITVELLLAVFVTPSMISGFVMENLNLDKACRVNKGFGDKICEALIKKASGNYSFYEKEVQKLISSIDIWKGVIQTALPCIIIVFLSAWSDRTGKRKVCILLPILGELLASISNLINVYFFYEIPVQVTVLLETALTSIFGGWLTVSVGVYSYITDITSKESRTFRVGLVSLCVSAGQPIGVGLSGYLLQSMGYYGVFSLTMVLFITALVYGCMFLKEPDQWLSDRGLPAVARSKDSNTTFFDLSHVGKTITVAYRPRADDRRAKIILVLFCVFILYGSIRSEIQIIYLFVRNQLNWNLVKHSLYSTFSIIVHALGAMCAIMVLSRKLKMNDALLGVISTFGKFSGSFWTAFVTTDLEMYLVPVLELLYAASFTTLRSIMSKLVEKDESAKANSLISLAEMTAALTFNPFYSWIYMKTLAVFPGTVFLITAALTTPAMTILMIFYIRHKIEASGARKTVLEDEEQHEAKAKLRADSIEKEDKINSI